MRPSFSNRGGRELESTAQFWCHLHEAPMTRVARLGVPLDPHLARRAAVTGLERVREATRGLER